MGSTTRGLILLLVFLGLTLALLPVQLVAMRLRRPAARRIPHFYYRAMTRVLGARVAVEGALTGDRPLLVVANHTSYLDIILLGAVVPGVFVAKSEVGSWPLFGLMARAGGTVFVERRGARAAEQRDEIGQRLASGEIVILFPEGTSNDGNRVLPFKSSLFSVAERRHGGKPLVVQPVSIAYATLDGLPLGRLWRPFYAWYGDMDLVPHLWQVLRLGRVGVRITLHPAVTIDRFADRKALAEHCQAVIAAGTIGALHGRREPAASNGCAPAPEGTSEPSRAGTVPTP